MIVSLHTRGSRATRWWVTDVTPRARGERPWRSRVHENLTREAPGSPPGPVDAKDVDAQLHFHGAQHEDVVPPRQVEDEAAFRHLERRIERLVHEEGREAEPVVPAPARVP